MTDTAEYPVSEIKELYRQNAELKLWKESALERMEEQDTFYQKWLQAESALTVLGEAAAVLTDAIRAAKQQMPVDILFRDCAPYKNLYEPPKQKRSRKP